MPDKVIADRRRQSERRRDRPPLQSPDTSPKGPKHEPKGPRRCSFIFRQRIPPALQLLTRGTRLSATRRARDKRKSPEVGREHHRAFVAAGKEHRACVGVIHLGRVTFMSDKTFTGAGSSTCMRSTNSRRRSSAEPRFLNRWVGLRQRRAGDNKRGPARRNISAVAHALWTSRRSTAALSGPASSIMIGENTGTDDFARRARVGGQCNRSEYVLQAGERIARRCLDTMRGEFFLRELPSGLLRAELGRGRHAGNSAQADMVTGRQVHPRRNRRGQPRRSPTPSSPPRTPSAAGPPSRRPGWRGVAPPASRSP